MKIWWMVFVGGVLALLATTANSEPTLVLGHRGYSGLWPENSLAAFQAAVAEGFDGVEMDLRRSNDNAAVVVHDATLDRTTKASGRVDSFPLEYLRDQVGLPTFDEVLSLLAPSQVLIAIEIKSPEMVETVVRQALASVSPDRIWLMSFSTKALRQVGLLAPGVRRVLLAWGPFGFSREFEGLSIPYWAYRLSRPFARAWQRSGKELLVWGIPSQAAMRALISDEVTAVVVDFLPSP